jgi:hypothetical protein
MLYIITKVTVATIKTEAVVAIATAAIMRAFLMGLFSRIGIPPVFVYYNRITQGFNKIKQGKNDYVNKHDACACRRGVYIRNDYAGKKAQYRNYGGTDGDAPEFFKQAH